MSRNKEDLSGPAPWAQLGARRNCRSQKIAVDTKQER
jgi:hypothetical protein